LLGQFVFFKKKTDRKRGKKYVLAVGLFLADGGQIRCTTHQPSRTCGKTKAARSYSNFFPFSKRRRVEKLRGNAHVT
jgi:hypothetical protein